MLNCPAAAIRCGLARPGGLASAWRAASACRSIRPAVPCTGAWRFLRARAASVALPGAIAMRELSLDRLRTLVAVADLGSFAAAAKALHLSPPTVTLHVAELEARVGARLLVRGRGGASPTGAGSMLLERARRLLAEADEAIDALRRHIQGRAGRVRVGASTGAIAHLLPRAL